jgi:hypothetical protein
LRQVAVSIIDHRKRYLEELEIGQQKDLAKFIRQGNAVVTIVFRDKPPIPPQIHLSNPRR